jgi:sialic acid synthase SpsE
MMKSPVVMLRDVPIGDGYPTVFVAETGTFFNKKIDIAIDYVDLAVEAGVKIFKTEILHDPSICLSGTGLEHEYNHANGKAVEDYRTLIERKIVSLKDYKRLFNACHERGIAIMASVYDKTGVDFVKNNEGCSIKIARNNINNTPLIRYAAKSNLPIILDMGDVYLEEIAHAVRIVREAGNDQVIVNLHPGANPASAEKHHLRTVNTIKSMFSIPVGLSCHYRGDEILYAAVGAGINLVEKGVDIDPDRVEQDLVSALPVSDLKSTVRKLELCWNALGNTYPDVKKDRDLTARAGLYAKKNIKKGTVLTEETIAWAFPPLGISVDEWDKVIGKRVKVDLNTGDVIHQNAIEFDD